MSFLIRFTFFLCLIATPLVFAQGSSDKQEKIKNATSAAPPSISDKAEVRDWPSEPHGKMEVLREGGNGWTCLPDIPDTDGDDPMCLDREWMAWANSWMKKEPYEADRMGFGYMLHGGAAESNTDPFAEGPTEDNEWIEEGVPHLMIVVPNDETLAELPTDPDNGGPWVMWKDTDYVHVMAPMPEYEPKQKQK